jgi:predicted DCC family thiol-disulfide oxidoreductase YuxK
VIQNDKENQFMFAALESVIGQKVINEYNIDTSQIDSILLYSKEHGLTIKSTAALTIAKHLSFPVNLVSVFLIIPPFIRNRVYDFIAKNRYKWFGKKDVCMIPTPELKSKFL